MPPVRVLMYREHSRVALIDWLEQQSARAQLKCLARLRRLSQQGHELRRPEADYLRDGIYELRVGLGNVNYRLLYFFHGRDAVIVSHGLTKQQEVPPREIDRAVRYKSRFDADPAAHTYEPELPR